MLSTKVFRSVGWWFEAQSLPLCCFLTASSTGFSKAERVQILSEEGGLGASVECEGEDWKRMQSASGR